MNGAFTLIKNCQVIPSNLKINGPEKNDCSIDAQGEK